MHRWLSLWGEESESFQTKAIIRGRSTSDYSSVCLIKGLACHCKPYLALQQSLKLLQVGKIILANAESFKFSTTCSNSLKHQSVDFDSLIHKCKSKILLMAWNQHHSPLNIIEPFKTGFHDLKVEHTLSVAIVFPKYFCRLWWKASCSKMF